MSESSDLRSDLHEVFVLTIAKERSMSTRTCDEEMNKVAPADPDDPKQAERIRTAIRMVITYLMDELNQSSSEKSEVAHEQPQSKSDIVGSSLY